MNRLFSALALGASIGATSPASAQQASLSFTGYVTDQRGFQSERAQRTEVFPPARSLPLLAVFKNADDNLTAISCTSLDKKPAANPAQRTEYAKASAACKAATFANN